MVEGKSINLSQLPSKGIHYPQDIEVYVKPMTAGEEMASNLEKFGISTAGYYDCLLDSILIKGSFDKNKLLFGDVQFIDLVRRLFSFELEEQISINDVSCSSCGKPLKVSFMFANNGQCENWVSFEDYKKEAFNEEIEFLDGTKVKISPVTIGDIIKIQRKYLSNMKEKEDIVDFLFALKAATITEAENKQFDSIESMQKYFIKYFKDLYKYKDLKLLEKIDEDTAVVVKPFKVACDKCSEFTEVALEPQLSFHQE